MSNVEQTPQQKNSEVVVADVRETMTLGEASDISSMTILRRQLEHEGAEEKPTDKVE